LDKKRKKDRRKSQRQKEITAEREDNRGAMKRRRKEEIPSVLPLFRNVPHRKGTRNGEKEGKKKPQIEEKKGRKGIFFP